MALPEWDTAGPRLSLGRTQERTTQAHGQLRPLPAITHLQLVADTRIPAGARQATSPAEAVAEEVMSGEAQRRQAEATTRAASA